MIPMRMKLNSNQSQAVIINKIFQASEIAPLAIQLDEFDENKKTFKILFKLNEHISDSDIFFEIRLLAEDDLDKSFLKDRSIYIDNIRKSEDKFKAFREIMKNFDSISFYVGDFNYEFENGNYYIDGFKQLIDQNSNNIFYETIRIYIPRSMLITTSLYLQDLLDPYNRVEREYLFASPDITSMRFDKVERFKILGSCKTKKDAYFSYDTMYEFGNGPTSWNFKYEILTEEDLELKKPIDEEQFKAWYDQYEGNFIGVVKEPNNLFCYVIVKNDKGRVVALMTRSEFINKTNLIDPYKIFVEEVQEESEDEEENNDIIEDVSTEDAESWSNTDENEEAE